MGVWKQVACMCTAGLVSSAESGPAGSERKERNGRNGNYGTIRNGNRTPRLGQRAHSTRGVSLDHETSFVHYFASRLIPTSLADQSWAMPQPQWSRRHGPWNAPLPRRVLHRGHRPKTKRAFCIRNPPRRNRPERNRPERNGRNGRPTLPAARTLTERVSGSASSLGH